jgi:hypothetical protein
MKKDAVTASVAPRDHARPLPLPIHVSVRVDCTSYKQGTKRALERERLLIKEI